MIAPFGGCAMVYCKAARHEVLSEPPSKMAEPGDAQAIALAERLDLLETGSAVSLQVLLRLAEEGLRRFAPCAHETLLVT